MHDYDDAVHGVRSVPILHHRAQRDLCKHALDLPRRNLWTTRLAFECSSGARVAKPIGEPGASTRTGDVGAVLAVNRRAFLGGEEGLKSGVLASD